MGTMGGAEVDEALVGGNLLSVDRILCRIFFVLSPWMHCTLSMTFHVKRDGRALLVKDLK
jgi:hypothetical protein